jgi:uncharacterized protein YheU (UPF0270 family)
MPDDETPAAGPIEIPIAQLEPATLRNIVADLVTRDGTDYGAQEWTHEQKAAALMRQLERGAARLVFDPETETIGLMTEEELRRIMTP